MVRGTALGAADAKLLNGERRPDSGPAAGTGAPALQPADTSLLVRAAARAAPGGGRTAADAAPRGLLSGAELRTGYAPARPLLDALINRGLAALMLPLASPLMLLIILLQLTLVRGPVFYSGTRLGKDRKPFKILKFRTLSFKAGSVTRDRDLAAPLHDGNPDRHLSAALQAG